VAFAVISAVGDSVRIAKRSNVSVADQLPSKCCLPEGSDCFAEVGKVAKCCTGTCVKRGIPGHFLQHFGYCENPGHRVGENSQQETAAQSNLSINGGEQPDFVWRAMESAHGIDVRTELELSSQDVTLGNRGVHSLGGDKVISIYRAFAGTCKQPGRVCTASSNCCAGKDILQKHVTGAGTCMPSTAGAGLKPICIGDVRVCRAQAARAAARRQETSAGDE